MHPRRPGSQVPPNTKAISHTRPSAAETDGKVYLVRDRNVGERLGRVWGQGLSWVEADRLKESVVGSGKSTTARVVEMVGATATPAEPPTDMDYMDLEIVDPGAPGTPAAPAPAPAIHAAPAGVRYEVAALDDMTVTVDGVVASIAPGHELVVNDLVQPVPVSVRVGDRVHVRVVDPQILAAQEAARAAVRPHAQAASARARKYRDVTVRPPAPPNKAPPRDKTVSKDRPLVRLGAPLTGAAAPPPSPLKVATEGGDEAAEGEITDGDLKDLIPDIGGGPSDADHEHAKRQREAEAGDRANG